MDLLNFKGGKILMLFKRVYYLRSYYNLSKLTKLYIFDTSSPFSFAIFSSSLLGETDMAYNEEPAE